MSDQTTEVPPLAIDPVASKNTTVAESEPLEKNTDATVATPEQVEQAISSSEDKKLEEDIKILDPHASVVEWTIGKPPTEGGTPDEYGVYKQRELGWIDQKKFFGIVTKAIKRSFAQGQSPQELISMLQGGAGANFGRSLLEDEGAWLNTILGLIAELPDLLLDCYIMWLDIPAANHPWARKVMSQRYLPEENEWGLTREQGNGIIEVFIDQNFQAIRDYFLEDLPNLAKRVQQRNAALASKSDSSKQ